MWGMLGMLGSFDRRNPMLRINVGNVMNECGKILGMLGMLRSFDRCILKIRKLWMLKMNVRKFW